MSHGMQLAECQKCGSEFEMNWIYLLEPLDAEQTRKGWQGQKDFAEWKTTKVF